MGVGLLFFLLSAVAFFLLHAVSQICKRRNGIGLLGLLGLLFGIRITFVLWRHFFSPHFHFVFFSVAYSGVPVVILGILYSQPAAGARVCFWFFIFFSSQRSKKSCMYLDTCLPGMYVVCNNIIHHCQLPTANCIHRHHRLSFHISHSVQRGKRSRCRRCSVVCTAPLLRRIFTLFHLILLFCAPMHSEHRDVVLSPLPHGEEKL
jgi:hypothetical protein